MKRAAAQVGTAAVIVAIAGYVAQFVAARLLGPADYTEFAVFWAVLFVVVGTLSGVSQEVVRVARVDKLESDSGVSATRTDRPRIGFIALGASTATAIVVLVTGLLWGPLAFGADWPVSVGLIALGSVLCGGTLAAIGTLAGRAEWATYSGMVIAEGASRTGVFVIAALVCPTVVGFSVAAAAAFLPGTLVALLWGKLRASSFAVRSDTGAREASTRMLRSMGASGLSGVLVIGWPALLSAAAAANPRGSTAAGLGILILLVTLTRAPLMVPLTSFQNVLIARFTGFDLPTRRRWVAVGIVAIVAVSGVLAVLAALLGPLLLTLLFGAEYQADGAIIGALTAASSGLGIITLTGVAAITASRHSVYLIGWGVAIAVALVVLFVAPVPFEWAAVLALIIGPVAGAMVQLLGLRSPR